MSAPANTAKDFGPARSKWAVGYGRYSTDRHQTDNSIAYQRDAIERFCEKNKLEMVRMYADEAITGTNTNRSGLQDLLQDAQCKAFDAVIIYDQSRLSRHVKDWYTLRETLRELEIPLYSCTEELDNSGEGGASFLSEGVRALFNHQFVLDVRAKTISGQAAKARTGVFLGGTPPLGYDVVKQQYVINRSEAEAVKLIYEMYLSGHGYGQIVDELKSRGIRSKRGAVISNNALFAILRNERYTGVYTWNKHKTKYLNKWAGGKENPDAIRIEGAVPQIIDRQTWEKVQQIMDTNKRKGSNTAKTEYILSGLLKCGECGASFVGVTRTSGRGYKTRYYICGAKQRKRTCENKNINADDLEVLVCSLLERDLLNEVIIGRLADDVLSVYKDNSGDQEKIARDIAECDTAINNLYKAIEKGLDAEDTLARIGEWKTKKKTLEIELRDFTAKAPSRESILAVLREDARQLKENRSGSLKAMIQKYVTQITITSDNLIIDCLGDIAERQNVKVPVRLIVLEGTKKADATSKDVYVSKDGCGGRI